MFHWIFNLPETGFGNAVSDAAEETFSTAAGIGVMVLEMVCCIKLAAFIEGVPVVSDIAVYGVVI